MAVPVLQMHSRIGKMVPWLPQTRSKGKGSGVGTVAWAKQEGKSSDMDLYRVLRISSDVGADEIKKAYRRMAHQCHPDVCLDPITKQESTRRFSEVRKAYEMLSDLNSLIVYDFELARAGSARGDQEEKRPGFDKKVWENQLQGLTRRSCGRMERKKNGAMSKTMGTFRFQS